MTAREQPDGHLLAIARRYEPAVISVVVIVLALLVAPRTTQHTDELPTFSAPGAQASPEVGVTSTTVPERALGAFTRLPMLAPSGPSTTAPPPQPPGPTTSTSTTTTIPGAVALTVIETGWSGADSGLSFSGFDVPEGALPVSNVLGEPDRRTYLRLSGTATVLTLDVVDDPVGSRFTENTAVWVCPITDAGWEGAPGMEAEDAPEYDCSVHIEGTAGEADDDPWTFDLAPLGDPARSEGFVLVAAEDASEFQILFADPTYDADA